MNSLLVGVLLLFLPLMAFATRKPPKLALALAEVADGDEDIKIASGHFSKTRSAEDAAELAAQEFLRQKASGNIDRARDLGIRYAAAMLCPGQGPIGSEITGVSMIQQHHVYLLYAYAVNRVIAENSPNSILAQTSLNIFFAEIEAASPELYKHIGDTAAFSLYILCERSKNRTDDEIGLIFAGLCGRENDGALAGYGNALYERFHAFCLQEMDKTDYVNAE